MKCKRLILFFIGLLFSISLALCSVNANMEKFSTFNVVGSKFFRSKAAASHSSRNSFKSGSKITSANHNTNHVSMNESNNHSNHINMIQKKGSSLTGPNSNSKRVNQNKDQHINNKTGSSLTTPTAKTGSNFSL